MHWLLTLLIINCAGPIGENSVSIEQTDSTGDEGQTPPTKTPLSLSAEEAFSEHVLPELQDSCGGCHAENQTPFFASDDAEIARRAIIDGGKVDFTDITKSRLVLRLSKDNHNCPDNCQEDSQRFVEVLTLWKKSKVVQPIDGLKTIDHKLGSSGSLSYDLSNLQISGQLLAEVELLSRGHGYLLRNLRLETGEQAVFVRVIKPLINNRWNALNTSFLQINCAIDPPGGRLQGRAATTIVADNLGSSNKLAFVFTELRLATDDDPTCRDDEASTPLIDDPPRPVNPPPQTDQKQTDFIAKIRPIMVDSCQGANCHTTTNRSYLFNYRQAYQRRTTIDQRITSDNDNLRMPPADSGFQLDNDDRNTLLDWLND